MSYKIIIKEDKASYNCHTIADLIEKFEINDFGNYMLENVFNNFPVDDKFDVIYDEYSIVNINDSYFVHIFHGTSLNPNESPEYTIALDLRHSNIYYIGHSNVGNYVNRYDLKGNLLSEEDYGLKTVDLDKFINDYLMEYPCKNIKELLSTFNVDIKLSRKLLQHEIDSRFGTVFNYYYIQKGKLGSYHVFPGFFLADVCDIHPPTIYIDSANDIIYFRSDTGWGVHINKYDCDNNRIKLTEFNYDLYGEYDLEKLLDEV